MSENSVAIDQGPITLYDVATEVGSRVLSLSGVPFDGTEPCSIEVVVREARDPLTMGI